MIDQNKKDISFLCFGGEDWWYHNRGHIDMQLMRCFSRMGTTLYINSIIMQKPNLKKNTGGGKTFYHKLIRKSKSIFRGLREGGAGFWVYSPFSIPAHHIKWLGSFNRMILQQQIKLVLNKLRMSNPIVWVACPPACPVALEIKKSKLIYQRTDRYEEFPNVDSEVIKQYDLELKANADLTVFVSEQLYEQEKSQCKEAVFLDHGVDYDAFAMAHNDQDIPSDISNINKPIVGFFGNIDVHIFDIALINKVVDLLPQMNFVFIGNSSIDTKELLAKKNVRMLGQKPYEQIPHYGKFFDVAIMPWQQNRWIEACNPIKLKEYLALGKPIVSTPFAELQKYDHLVYQARTPEEFAKCIEKALQEDNPERIAARRKRVEPYTWEKKAELVLNKVFEQ